MSKAILITGATGKQGGAVLHHLATQPSASQFTLLAVTRNTTSATAQKLTEKYPSVILVQGDLNNTPALFSAAKDALKKANKDPKIWGVYSVQISIGPSATPAVEIAQGTALINESLKENVAHFVYSSVDRGGNKASFSNQTPIPHFQTKHRIEQHLLEKAGKDGERMPWTILRPVAFMENLEPGMQTKVFLAAMRDTMLEKPMQWVSVDDIGLFAAKAFTQPGAWRARAEGLAGDELTFAELAGCFERATGAPVPATYGFLGSALMWAVTELRLMITWFKTDGYRVDVAGLRKMEPGVCGLERFLRERSGFVKR